MKQARSSSWQSITRTLIHLLLISGALASLIPFWFMFVFATHTDRDILSLPPPLWFGHAWTKNADDLLSMRPYFWRSMVWSFYISSFNTVLNLFFCSLTGFAFALYRFRFKRFLFAVILNSILLPAFVGMVPTVLIMNWLGWLDHSQSLIIPSACSAFGVLLMRQYIASAISRDLIDAARLDGCTEFGLYWRIVLPLIKPALITLALMTFIGNWNNFSAPMLLLRSTDKFTVALTLRSLQGSEGVSWGAMNVGAAIAVLPLILLFTLSSRRLIDGMTAATLNR